LAGKSARFYKSTTTELIGVAIVLLGTCKYINRVGQNRIYTLYITVYLTKSLLKIPCIHRIYMVLVNPIYKQCSITQIFVYIVPAHHGPTPAFQTIKPDRACLGSILKGSRHSDGGQEACFQGFQKCTIFAQQTGPRTKSFWGKFSPPLFFALIGMV
jgi:hypothetical protein